MQNYRSESIDRLFKTFLNLKNIDECYEYFDDLCTIKEILDMAQRLDTAILLDKGENYNEIREKVKISTATISRVNRCLTYGSDGYVTAIKRLKEEKN